MKRLEDLQKKIASVNYDVWDDPAVSRLLFVEISGLYHIEFYGEGYDDNPSTPLTEVDYEDNYPYLATLETIADISQSVSFLSFRGPDEGANGFRNWDFSRLINSECIFKNLLSFEVELTDPGFHNLSCITPVKNDYEENGMVANLVKNMPKLKRLVIPSAPNQEFFNVHLSDLQYLRIEAGYDTEKFISNYSVSTTLPNLSVLDYSDISFVTDEEERKKAATKYEDFEALFKSQAFKTVRHFTLRNSILSIKELIKLQEIRSDLQFLVVSSLSGQYVNNFNK